jgi:hypothetical protein
MHILEYPLLLHVSRRSKYVRTVWTGYGRSAVVMDVYFFFSTVHRLEPASQVVAIRQNSSGNFNSDFIFKGDTVTFY